MSVPLDVYKWLLATDPKDSSEWLSLAASLRILAYEASYPLVTRKMFSNVEQKASAAGLKIPVEGK